MLVLFGSVLKNFIVAFLERVDVSHSALFVAQSELGRSLHLSHDRFQKVLMIAGRVCGRFGDQEVGIAADGVFVARLFDIECVLFQVGQRENVFDALVDSLHYR